MSRGSLVLHKGISHIGFFILLWLTLFLFFPFPPTLSGLELLWGLSRQPSDANTRDFVGLALVGSIITLAAASLVYLRHSLNWLLLSATGIVLLSVFHANQREAFVAVALWSFFFVAALLAPDGRRLMLIAWVCILGMQMMVALAAYFLSYDPFITPGFGKRAGGLFGNPNPLYPWSVISFFVFLELSRSLPANKLRTFVFLGAVGSLAVLVLTFSRAGWLGLAVGLLIVAMAQPFKHKASAAYRAVCLSCALCLICGAATVRTQGAVVSSANDGSTAGRFAIWRGAFPLWQKHPWLGNGYNAFRLPSAGGVVAGEPKNLVLHVALQTGLAGVLLHGLYFGSVLVLARKIALRSCSVWSDAVIARATFLSVVALLIVGLLDTPVFGPLYRVPPTITLLIFTGLLQAASIDDRTGDAQQPLT